jgi:transposase
MEACSGANYWCRKFTSFGHITKLISPQFVKPFVKGNKTDRNDSEAICEAASRPTMRFVSSKSVAQEDMQALHRIRSRLIQGRTALINQIRGLLTEYGITIAQGINKARKALPEILEDGENELSAAGRRLFADLYEELLDMDNVLPQVKNEPSSKQLTYLMDDNITIYIFSQPRQ